MKKSINYDSFFYEELNAERKKVVSAAYNALMTSYSPYSEFKVGAAVENSDGKIFTGSNQENVAFGAGICAERAVLYSSGVVESKKIVRIAIVAHKNCGEVPVSPCGICRQSLAEVENRQKEPIEVIFMCNSKYIVVESVKDLLPFSFDSF